MTSEVSMETAEQSVGVGRWAYFGLTLLIGMISGVLEVAAGEDSVVLFVLLAAAIGALVVGGYRYKSIGYSPGWILLAFIPIVNIFIAYQLLALPPRFARTKEWDFGMKVVTGLYLALFGLILLALIGGF